MAAAIVTGVVAANVQAAPLAEQVAALVGKYQQEAKNALVGVSLVDLHGGKTLASIRDHDLYKPASNQKLLTTAFALARLGGSFEFTTEAYLVGGDLWVFGSGDPTFGDPILAEDAHTSIYAEMDRWAAAIRNASPTGIAGNIVVSESFTRDQAVPLEALRAPEWPKNQYHNWYEAPVCGLNFNNNCLDVMFTGSKGAPTPVVSPASRLIQVASSVKIDIKKGSAWGALLSDSDAVVTLKGTVSKVPTETQNIAVNEPALLFGRVLADRLLAAGVKFGGKVVLADPAAAAKLQQLAPVARTVTPLAAVVRRANKRSLNMAAECVFLRAGDGTWAGSAKAMAETLASTYGLTAAEMDIHDGSGMSKGNQVAPAAITKLLAALAGGPNAAIVTASLPISGKDGTLERRMDVKPYEGRVLGKTGWISGVSCLSGYVLDRAGKPAVAFSILCNKVPAPAKQLQDDICRRTVDWLDGPK